MKDLGTNIGTGILLGIFFGGILGLIFTSWTVFKYTIIGFIILGIIMSLTETDSDSESKKHNSDLIIKGKAKYWGGHFLHPSDENGDEGEITLTKNKLVFKKSGRDGWIIEIPINKILFRKVSQRIGDDIDYKNKMAATAFFAGVGPMTSFSQNITYLIIPFKDEKGVEQAPRFTFKKKETLKVIAKFLYEKIPPKNK